MVWDLHAGKPADVRLAIEALEKPPKEGEAFKDEVTIIVISSLLAWDRTPKKLEEIKNPDEPDSDEEKAKVGEGEKEEANR